MKLIIAVNHESLQNYLKRIDGIEIVRILVSKKNLIKECEENTADAVLVSNNLAGEENIQDLLIKISNSKFFSGRIIYLYGEDDSKRKEIIHSLILNGIYDYYVGDLDQEIVKELLFKPKNRNDVKNDILENYSYNPVLGEVRETEEKEKVVFIDRVEEVTRVETQVITEIPKDYKKTVGFIGERNVGRTFTLLQIATYLSEEIKVAVVDNTANQGLSYYFKKNDEIIEINKNLIIYPGEYLENKFQMLDHIKQKSDLVIIDFDLTEKHSIEDVDTNLVNNLPIFLDGLYIVTDSDPSHAKYIYENVRFLTSNNITDNKIKIIFNKIIVKSQVKGLFDLYRFESEGKSLPKLDYFKLKMLVEPKIYEDVINFNNEVYKKDEEYNRQIEIIAKDIFSINKATKKSFFKKIFK
jgi:hypothetical protein